MAVEVKEHIGYVIDTEMPEIASREFLKHVHFKVIDGVGVGAAAAREHVRDSRFFLIQGGRNFLNDTTFLMDHDLWAITGRTRNRVTAQPVIFEIMGRSNGRIAAASHALYIIEKP